MCQIMHGLNQEAIHLQLNMREKWLLNCLLCMQSKPLASQYTRQAPMCSKYYTIGHKMTWSACPLQYFVGELNWNFALDLQTYPITDQAAPVRLVGACHF